MVCLFCCRGCGIGKVQCNRIMKKMSFLVFLLISLLSGNAFQVIPDRPEQLVTDTLRPSPYQFDGKPVLGTAGIYNKMQDSVIAASGETFLQTELVAASNRFPLHSWVKITNQVTKKFQFARIIDTLPANLASKGRLLMVSKAVALKLGLLKKINSKIKVQKIVAINTNTIDSIEKKAEITLWDSSFWLNDSTLRNITALGKAVNGIASFYSRNLDGTKTATGEIYRNRLLTAASNHFKLNTWVLVTNLVNNKSVIVRINDRMHPRMKKKGRVVDMSGEGARILDYKSAGLTKVRVAPILIKDSIVSPIPDIADSMHIIRVPADQGVGIFFPAGNNPKKERRYAGTDKPFTAFNAIDNTVKRKYIRKGLH